MRMSYSQDSNDRAQNTQENKSQTNYIYYDIEVGSNHDIRVQRYKYFHKYSS